MHVYVCVREYVPVCVWEYITYIYSERARERDDDDVFCLFFQKQK